MLRKFWEWLNRPQHSGPRRYRADYWPPWVGNLLGVLFWGAVAAAVVLWVVEKII